MVFGLWYSERTREHFRSFYGHNKAKMDTQTPFPLNYGKEDEMSVKVRS
jgi:hypothetical protein